jgi:hypothetical protein
MALWVLTYREIRPFYSTEKRNCLDPRYRKHRKHRPYDSNLWGKWIYKGEAITDPLGPLGREDLTQNV